jgi:hypothetical protein
MRLFSYLSSLLTCHIIKIAYMAAYFLEMKLPRSFIICSASFIFFSNIPKSLHCMFCFTQLPFPLFSGGKPSIYSLFVPPLSTVLKKYLVLAEFECWPLCLLYWLVSNISCCPLVNLVNIHLTRFLIFDSFFSACRISTCKIDW